ncbi:MAG: hypothetical protein KDI15_04245, partial [Thiothrix sp.]|nr:hypothetical protein [Thiothrix sp.]
MIFEEGRAMMKGRYLLGECLFSAPDVGELYRARDSTRLQAEVLLQVFPARLLDYSAFRTAQAELRRKTVLPAAIRHLPLLDSYRDEQASVFVLQAPSSWAVNVLPALQPDRPTSLHARAATVSRTLQQQGIIRQPLGEHWFLVAPDGELYLLGTALSARLLSCQPMPVPLARRPHPAWRSWVVYAAILVSASAVLAGGIGLYHIWSTNRPLPARGLTFVTPAEVPVPEGLQQQDRPLPEPERDLRLATSVVKGLPDAALKSPESLAGVMLPAPVLEDRVASLSGVSSLSGPEAPSDKDDPGAEAAPDPTLVRLPDKPLSVTAAGEDATEAPAVMRLMERVRAALAQEHFQSALYHIRELRQLDVDHPEVTHLGKQLVAILH